MTSKLKSVGAMLLAAGMITGMSAFAAEIDAPQVTKTVRTIAVPDGEFFVSYFSDADTEAAVYVATEEDGVIRTLRLNEDGEVVDTEILDIGMTEAAQTSAVQIAVLDVDGQIYGVAATDKDAYEFFKVSDDGTHEAVAQEELDAEIADRLIAELNAAPIEEMAYTIVVAGEGDAAYGFTCDENGTRYFMLDEDGNEKEISREELPAEFQDMAEGNMKFQFAVPAVPAQ